MSNKTVAIKLVEAPPVINSVWVAGRIDALKEALKERLSSIEKQREAEVDIEKRRQKQFQQDINSLGLKRRKESVEKCKEITTKYNKQMKEVEKEIRGTQRELKRMLKEQEKRKEPLVEILSENSGGNSQNLPKLEETLKAPACNLLCFAKGQMEG